MYTSSSVIESKIRSTNGKIFKIVFTKKDNTKRVMSARIGVRKGLVGAGRSKKLPDNMINVYDMVNHGYRTINLDSVEYFQCGSNILSL